ARKQKEAAAGAAAYVELLGDLATGLPRDVVLATDNAMACYYGAMPNLPMYTPSYLFPTGYGTLGYGLPAAIGAKLAAPERPVVAMLGDGGVMFTVQELATAAELGMPLPVVIVDNTGYGEIRAEMLDRHDPVHAVTFAAPDFALLGQALGCGGVTLDGPDGLGDAVRAALSADRPTFIHVRLSEGASS
ncbi:MAG: thiamine pyrophosphate-dependent enzyme, partial [Marmoricola sp.]